MRIRTGLFLAVLLSVVMSAGCGGPAKESGKGEGGRQLKVALLSPGPVNDGGWNQLGYQGLLLVEKELGARVNQKQTESPADFEGDFREYASQGYDVIIGHGFELQPAAIKVSKEFPDTVFVITAGSKVEGKVVPIIPKLEEATYLLGVMAARMSKTGKAGLVGGMEIPPIKSTFEAFRKGAVSVNPQFKVSASFIGNWEDTAAAKEATRALIQQGCDFIFHNADAAGRGVFEACREARGVYAFGSNSDQNGIAPDVILASAVLEIPRTFVEICQSVQDGTFQPREYELTVANGHTSVVINPRLKDVIPQKALDEIEDLKEQLRSGRLKVERAHF